jgi:hypothetical protein
MRFGVIMSNENKNPADNSEMALDDLLKFIEEASPEELAALADSAGSGLDGAGQNESEIDLTIRRWINKQIDGTELLRRLVSFDKWDVAIDDEELFRAIEEKRPSKWAVFEENGEKRLFVFTGSDAERAFTGDGGGSFTQAPGTHVFGSLDERFDFICINPYSDTAIGYGREHFAMLREMAEAVKIERKLKDLRAGEELDNSVWAEIKNYPNYILPVKTDAAGNWAGIPMAPDEKNRRLLPVFTAEDYFFVFQKDYFDSAPETDLRVVAPYKLNGTELFRQILKMENLDGVVFNCESGNPVAFAPQIAQVILNQAPAEKFVQIDYKEALMFANGFVAEAEYDSTIFCRFPAERINGETVDPEKLERICQILYGANWRHGNDDGSRYLVLRPEMHILTTAEEQSAPWRNVNLHDKNHHYWFFKISGANDVNRVQQADF